MSANCVNSRIMFPEDSSEDEHFLHTDDEVMEGDGSNNRCDDGDKNAKEQVCTHCNIAFNNATALQEHLSEIIRVNMKKKNIDGTVKASIGKTRSKPSANVQNNGHGDSNSNRRSIVSEDSDSQDSGSEDLDSKDEKMTKKSSFPVRNSNIMVMYECLICHTHLRSQYYAQKHRRSEHPGLPGARFFKTVYMKKYAPNVKDTKSKTATSKVKRSRGISINKIHIENMNLSDLPEAVKTRPKYQVQNAKDTTKKAMKTNNTDKAKVDKTSRNSKGLQKTNMERKRKRDTSSGKVRRTSQDGEESHAQALYRCNRCEVHFVSKKTASTHLESCPNGVTPEPVNCGKCGRSFEPNELATHSVRDHRHSEMELKIVNISPVPERQTPKGTPSEKKQDNSPKQDKVPLFKCQKCDAHFVTASGLRMHKRRDRHGMELIQCEICDFSFTTRSHNAHIIEHHDRLGLRRQDFEVVANNVPDPSRSRRTRDTASESDSSDETDTNVTEEETSESDQDWSPKKKDRESPPVMRTLQKPKTKSYTKNMSTAPAVARATATKYRPSKDILYKCGEKRSSNTKHDQKVAQTDADKIKPFVAEPEAIPSTSSQNSTVVPTLFKCLSCDVHFTEESACLSHIVDHEPFDRLQFLKCPECELQYENSCLLRHRVVHRGEFDFAKMLVKAYMPCENSFDIPTIEMVTSDSDFTED